MGSACTLSSSHVPDKASLSLCGQQPMWQLSYFQFSSSRSRNGDSLHNSHCSTPPLSTKATTSLLRISGPIYFSTHTTRQSAHLSHGTFPVHFSVFDSPDQKDMNLNTGTCALPNRLSTRRDTFGAHLFHISLQLSFSASQAHQTLY